MATAPPSSQQLGAFLVAVRGVESGNYTNLSHGPGGASGAYQFEPATWQQYAAQVPGAAQYSYAAAAPPAVQDAVAARAATSSYIDHGGNWYRTAQSWYYPAWADGAHENDAPPGNKLTMAQYGTRLLAIMNVALQSNQQAPVDVPGYPSGGQTVYPSNATVVGVLTTLDGLFNPHFKGGLSLLNPAADIEDLGFLVEMVVVRGTAVVMGLGLLAVGVYLLLGQSTQRAVRQGAELATGAAVVKRVSRRRQASRRRETTARAREEREAGAPQRAYDTAKAREMGRAEGRRGYRSVGAGDEEPF